MDFKLSSMRKEYIYPGQMKRKDGSSRYAFVTFLMRNDNYLPGALMFAYGLRKKGTQADLVCMTSGSVSNTARFALQMIYDYVVDIYEIYVPSIRNHDRQDIPYVFTRFNALRLGADGDLGFEYEKIVLADADVLPLRFYDHLFTLEAPAGIINESRNNFAEYDCSGGYSIPENLVHDGKWKWHSIYEEICPHGHHIPKYITDRVESNPMNLGINSSLFVLVPSYRDYEIIMHSLDNPYINDLVCRKFRWPEMQYATMIWSGEWTNVDVRFCSINGYPDISVLCGIHFAGIKPWNVKDERSRQRASHFPDYCLWYEEYLDMMEEYDGLKRIPKLTRLSRSIEELLYR